VTFRVAGIGLQMLCGEVRAMLRIGDTTIKGPPDLREPLSQRQLETGGVRIPRKALHRFAEKICRGIFYIEEKVFIDASCEIEAHVVKEGGGAEVEAILDQYGASYTRGPGLLVRRAKTNDDPMSSLFFIEIWGQLKMYASIVRAP
jgi:hypothetical protein